MTIEALAAAFAALVAGAYFGFFRWRKIRKSGCVIFDHVSRDTNAFFQWPNRFGAPTANILDSKLDQVVGALDALPSASLLACVTSFLFPSSAPQGINWNDVHIVYRAVWNDHPVRPVGMPTSRARIVTWRLARPEHLDDTTFANPNVTPAADDRDGFFRWVYDNCPADHYAVFFWGHSIGPGGLFELSKSVAFPALSPGIDQVAPASLTEIQQTLDILVALRSDQPPPPAATPVRVAMQAGGGNAPGVQTGGGGSGTNGQTSTGTSKKVDLVLFQDCWMATLETAYELENVARYIVGSQSLVPIGYTYDQQGTYVSPSGPTWPYEQLIGRLMQTPKAFDEAVATAVVNMLKAFFDQATGNRQPSPVVTFSLLDLGEAGELSAQLTPKLVQFVKALAALSKVERKLLLAGATIVKFENQLPNVVSYVDDLETGEWTLIDVLKMCTRLTTNGVLARFNQTQASQLVMAAQKLSQVIDGRAGASGYHLVRQVFETSPPPTWVPIGFSGVSWLWIPDNAIRTPTHDGYIANQISNSFYSGLRIVHETAPNPAAPGWNIYAFEQR